MFVAKTPKVVPPIAKHLMFKVPNPENKVYLTFDDGPVPEATPLVLDLLAEYQAKATFFCVGSNLDRHWHIAQRALNEGHTLGNHTQNHLNGWKTKNYSYYKNILEGQKHLEGTLFRPPYGRISPQQSIQIAKRYQIVMWDVLTGDYDRNRSADQCVKAVMDHTKAGSIIVMHDSKKALPNLESALPKILSWLHSQNYELAAIPLSISQP